MLDSTNNSSIAADITLSSANILPSPYIMSIAPIITFKAGLCDFDVGARALDTATTPSNIKVPAEAN
jgi:hypothetical protein